MVRRDGAEIRRERIGQIARTIQSSLFQAKESGEISFSKTVGAIMYETGLTKEKVVEYIGIIEARGQFELDVSNDMIKTVKA